MSTENDRLLVLRSAGKRFAIDLVNVTEVTELPEIWPIPRAPDYFKGVLNSHGSLVPLLDLARWMGTSAARVEGKVLLLDRTLADLALWVDDVERVISSSDAALLRDSEGLTAAVLLIGDDEVPLISATGLVDLLETDLQGTV